MVSNEFKEQREVQTGTSSNFRAKGNEVPKIPFTYKKYKEKYIIIELKGLPQGEYGIILGSMEQTNAELKFQLFGIDYNLIATFVKKNISYVKQDYCHNRGFED